VEELIAQCAQGDRKAQYALYQQYAPAMMGVCLRMLGRPDEAEDALQEAFVKAFRSLAGFKGASTFGAWLKRIVVNQCLNQLRARRAWLVEWNEQAAEALPEAEPAALPALQVPDVQRAIQALPDGFRTVLSLYLVEGYDHQEIAEILGISEATSKSQYSRAKARLRDLLRAAAPAH
jgi:RNA polymerase sigma-70 factor (ECF subfamily)